MKTLFFSLGVALFFTLAVGCQETSTKQAPAATANDDAQLFAGLMEQVGSAIARKDTVALGRLMAPEYVHYNPNGETGHKADELAFISTWPPTTVKTGSLSSVTRLGDAAVTVSSPVFDFADEKGAPVSRKLQMMILWVLHDGNWQMSIVQSKDLQPHE